MWTLTQTQYGPFLRYESPKDRNALSLECARQLKQHLHTSSESGAYVAGIAMGRPNQLPFCAGGNLNDYISLERKEALQKHQEIRQTLQSISALPLYLQFFVGGDVWGGGWELLTLADEIQGWSAARFNFNQTHWGVSPGWGGGARLRAKLGPLAFPSVMRAREISYRYLITQGFGSGILPRDYFLNDAHLLRFIERSWRHLEGFSLEAWRDLLQGMRHGDPHLETQAFSQLWAQGKHAERLAQWKQS